MDTTAVVALFMNTVHAKAASYLDNKTHIANYEFYLHNTEIQDFGKNFNAAETWRVHCSMFEANVVISYNLASFLIEHQLWVMIEKLCPTNHEGESAYHQNCLWYDQYNQ